MKELIKIFESNKYAAMDVSDIPTSFNKILLENKENGNILKILLFSETQEGKEILFSTYTNMKKILKRLENKPYCMKIYDLKKTRNCILIESKKYQELDKDNPIWDHYYASYLIDNNIVLEFFDILYDMWKSGVYISDRFPSRNICRDENGQMILIDYDILDEFRCDDDFALGTHFMSYKSMRYLQEAFPNDFEMIDSWYKENTGKYMADYYDA
jgi:hypothetical protein